MKDPADRDMDLPCTINGHCLKIGYRVLVHVSGQPSTFVSKHIEIVNTPDKVKREPQPGAMQGMIMPQQPGQLLQPDVMGVPAGQPVMMVQPGMQPMMGQPMAVGQPVIMQEMGGKGKEGVEQKVVDAEPIVSEPTKI